MTRPIKFRGKTTSNTLAPTEWAYGYYMLWGDRPCIFSPADNGGLVIKEIDPTTLGQYIEIKNGSGDGLYEGDLVRFHSDGCHNKPNLDDLIGEITLSGSKWVLRTEYGDYDIENETDEFYAYGTIIGNIHNKQ